ncbi:DUF6541 family protein [Geodermatophilus sp. SYSU D01045]
MSDTGVLLAGLALLYLPGLLFLAVCRVRSLVLWVGAAPAVTLGLLQVAALLGAPVGAPVWTAGAALLAVLAVAGVVLEVRAGADGVVRGVLGSAVDRVRTRPWAAGLAVAAVGTGCWLASTTWLRGFHGLSTPSQEHDMVQHLLMAAYVARTGEASPFELMPLDLATGENARFYPGGLHTFAGLVSDVAPDPVVGFNAATVLVLGVAAPVTLFAAVVAVAGRRDGLVAGALAALFASVLYRPSFQLALDGGILGYAAGLALAPVVACCLLRLPRRLGADVLVTPVVVLAVFAVHPSMAVFVAGTTAVAGAVALPRSPVRRWVAERWRVLLATGGATVVLLVPWLLASSRVGDQVSSYPERPATEPFLDVALRLLRFTYSGFFDPGQTLYHAAFAVLFAVGALGCLTRLRLLPLLAAWAAWALLAIAFNAGLSGAPVVAQVAGFFYNSLTRLVDLSWVLAPAVAGAGLAALLGGAAELAARPGRGDAGSRRARVLQAAGPVVAAALALVFLLTAGLSYRDRNTEAVAARYGEPGFVRVSADDRAAFDWLGDQDDVGRVLNNGNDGSTYLYVYEGIPVVNVFPLGVAESRYGIYLMEHFDRIATDPKVRCLVQRYDITHLLVSRTSPPVWAAAAPFGWVDTPLFDAAPGFAGLDDVDEVDLVFRNGDASVYAVDESVLDGDDEAACTADPAAP